VLEESVNPKHIYGWFVDMHMVVYVNKRNHKINVFCAGKPVTHPEFVLRVPS